MPQSLFPLRRHLLILVLVGTLPLAICAAVALSMLLRNDESQAINRALEANRQTATAVRVTLDRSFTVLAAVAQSPLADNDDLGPFIDLLERVLPLMPGWRSLLIASPDGRMLKRVSPESSAPLPAPVENTSFKQVIATPGRVVGALGKGPSGTWAIPLRVPVIRDGKVRYVLTAPLMPENIAKVLTSSQLPTGWTVSVFDSNGRRIARIPSLDFAVGDQVSTELSDLMNAGSGNEGSGVTHTTEGTEVYTAYARLPDLGWTVATGIPTSEVTAKLTKASLIYGGGLALSLLFATLGAIIAARRISIPMQELRGAALAVGRDQIPRLPNTRITEIRDVALALQHSATAVKAGEQARDEVLADLARANERLLEADRRKDIYIATLAHELRNPMAPVVQAAALLRSPVSSVAQRNNGLDVIERQMGHMSRLLDDLLDLSRVNFGKITLREQRVELCSVLSSAVECIALRAEEKKLNVHLSIPGIQCYLDGDELRLQQLFVNLLDNATKYTSVGGQIWVTVRVYEPEVEIEVADDGIGIAKEQQDEIFQTFSRVTGPGIDVGGLGVGLPLAKSLAELHGGRIQVTSAGLGRGSSFKVTLPLSEDQSQNQPAPQPVLAAATAARRILVVDDSEDIAAILQDLFELEGHEVRVAFNGQEAVDSCIEEMPDVVVMDIGMPVMDGYQAASAIRILPAAESVCLIAVSGWGNTDDVSKALDAGFDSHLTKPADFDKLLALVAKAERRDRKPAESESGCNSLDTSSYRC